MSTRIYSFESLVALPRLTASTANALLTQTLNTAAVQEQQLETTGQQLPPLIARSRNRLESAARALKSALEPVVVTVDSGAAKEADQQVDGAWGGFYNFLVGWSRVDPAFCPDPQGVASLMQLLFSDGLSFVKFDYRTEWSESDSRLEAVGKSPYADSVVRLGAQGFVEALKKAQASYGQALGLTGAKPAEVTAELRRTRDAALDALREYVVKVVAWAEPEEAGSQALSEALLAPLESWVSPVHSSGTGSSSQAAAGEGATAGAAASTGTGASTGAGTGGG